MSAPDEDMDPANWDCCGEHETVFRKGGTCEKCLEEGAREPQQDAVGVHSNE